MNKARITYRFDDHGTRYESSPKDKASSEGVVIPLHPELSYEAPAQEGKPSEHSEAGAMKASKQQIYDTQPLNPLNLDYGAWNSSFDIETQHLEEVIRKSERYPYGNHSGGDNPLDPWDDELFKTKSWEDEHTDYETGYVGGKESHWQSNSNTGKDAAWPGLDQIGPIYDESFSSRNYTYRKRSPSWITMISAAAGAIITGILFGVFVLSVFNGGDILPDAITPATDSLLQEQVNETAQITEQPITSVPPSRGAAATQSGIALIDIPAKSYFVLQNGMFSELSGAEQAIQILQSNGFVGVSDPLDHYYVYAGISQSRDDALFLSHLLQENGLETYIKTLELPALTEIKWNGNKGEVFENYISESSRLVEMISNISLIHLTESNPVKLDEPTVEALKSAHQDWTHLNSQAGSGLPADLSSLHHGMTTAMNTAVLTMEQYQKNPSHAYLWESQRAIMEYVVLERQLLRAVSN